MCLASILFFLEHSILIISLPEQEPLLLIEIISRNKMFIFLPVEIAVTADNQKTA